MTTWHRMKRTDWYATGTDSHDAEACPYEGAPGTLGGCPAEVVAPSNPRADLRESWMQGEQDRRSYTLEDRVARLADLRAAVARAEWGLAHEVEDARLAGVVWSSIGGALGITRQAAQQRYTR